MSAGGIARVLIIAGSDSSGGAGIQADIKTVTALGGYAATAVTAITVQDTTGVHGVHGLPADLVRRQMDAVMADIGADALKTGMLHSAEIIAAVADAISAYEDVPPLVVDPVMVATSGDRLLERDAEAAMIGKLLPLAFMATPNIHEAAVLANMPVKTAGDMREAAQALLASGPDCVLVTGGDLGGDVVVDVLATPMEIRTFTSPRIATTSTHGTGCTLASAIATFLAQGRDVGEAVEDARDYVHMAMTHAPGLGAGAGPLDHGWVLRDRD
ncbi:bifunctional hydroxymethylpyrimidine kinase/phosphomethylpyrimidine kinase [Pyruvatibacter sp.]|uniref:bifunctional hydroxymethylpyrimidine kinase/phosphomethylpyrimidine kinase n=1 Tax=Pyruvatibacter sp. TaxID=1981328 RepID=UPI0032ED18C9